MSKPMSRAEMKDWANETWQKCLDESRNEGKTMTDRELMQQALDALMAADPDDMIFDAEGHMVFRKSVAINALRDRLAQPEQKKDWQYVQQLNAFSYPRQWVGLTDEEVKHMLELFVIPPQHIEMVVQAIEAKLKEKNA
jgi:hypothetical protein